MKLAVLATAALIASGGVAFAHDTFLIDETQARQRHRIEHGRHTGQLTWREYRRLLDEQADIAAMERRARADGHVNRREYHAIRMAQYAARRHIGQQLHDAQHSRSPRWRHRVRWEN